MRRNTFDTVQILLLEANDADAERIVRAIRKRKISNPIVRAASGSAALERLRDRSLRPPLLVLLDLLSDGSEFLAELRRDPAFRATPVVALTTPASTNGHFDVSGRIEKSRVADDFMTLVERLDLAWQVVERPPQR